MVVDVGNSRIKWGSCASTGLLETVSLPHDDPAGWARQVAAWNLGAKSTWIVSGVNPRARDAFADWLRQRGHAVRVIDSPDDLPLTVLLERPDHVGIDRLFNAVAANTRRDKNRPAVLVDAGSAVTVDWLDSCGAFCGGAIFPGLRLMTEALHRYTALLPLVPIKSPLPAVPGVTTPAAVEAGVYWALVGGVQAIISRLARQDPTPPMIFLAGGDAPLLVPGLDMHAIFWPEITLEGIRLAAQFKMVSCKGDLVG